MHPETLLDITTAFAGFLLKTSLGFCICWTVSRVVTTPSGRFLIWLGFLAGAGCYWLWLAQGLAPYVPAIFPHTLPVILPQGAPVAKWQIQPSWVLPLSFVWRGLGVLYLIALGRFLLARIKKQAHLRWMLRFAYRAPEEIENIFQPIVESLERGKVRLLVLPGINSPAMFGWIRPAVLLPPFCLQQGWSELENVFRHELQHVRRRDFIFHTIASLCRALLFFHPAAWYAMRRLKLESELACDLAVVNDSPERRATYAECLVRFARLNAAQGSKSWNLDFASSAVQLKVRVRSVLAETRKNSAWLLGLRASLGVLLLAGFLGIAPSLFIALTYTQKRIAQHAPANPSSRASRPQAELRKRSTSKVSMRDPAVRPGRALDISPENLPAAAPVEAGAAQISPRDSRATLSSGTGPILKRRSDFSGVAAPDSTSTISTPTMIIPISTEPSSQFGGLGSIAGVAASIITMVSQIGSIADHSRGKSDH